MGQMTPTGIDVTINKHPLRVPSERDQAIWKELEGPIKDYMPLVSDIIGLDESEILVIRNGAVEEDWGIIPTPGDNLCFQPRIGAFAIPFAISFGVSMAMQGISMGIQAMVGTSYGAGVSVDSMMPRIETPVPSISGLGLRKTASSLTYQWSGPANSRQPGLPIPVLYGKCRVGLQVINTYMETQGKNDILYTLFGVAEGDLDSVVVGADVDAQKENIWLGGDLRMSDTVASFDDTNKGTYNQTALDWFPELHQTREIGINCEESMKLLLHMETAGLTDSSIFETSPSRVNINNNVVRSAAQEVFGSYSALFSGADTDYLDVDYVSDWNLGAGDFTIDFRMRLAAAHLTNNTNCCLLNWENYTGNKNGWALWLWQNGSGERYLYLTSWDEITQEKTTFVRSRNTQVTFPDSTWRHIAVVRSGSRFYVMVDGDENTSSQWEHNGVLPIDPASSNVALGIGRKSYSLSGYGTNKSFEGYIDELRITNRAEWTQDFQGDLPSVPYTDEFSGATVETRGECDKMRLHFNFPYGLYSAEADGTISFKEVEFYLKFKGHQGSTWYTYKNELQKIAGASRSPFKAQMDFAVNTFTYSTMNGTIAAGDQVEGNNTDETAYVAAIDTSIKRCYLVGVADMDDTPFNGDTALTKVGAGGNYITKASGLVPIKKKDKWEIQVWRTTGSDGTGSDKSTMFLDYLDEVYRQSLAYPNTAQLGVRVEASEKLSGSRFGDVSIVADRGYKTLDYWGSATSKELNSPAWAGYDVMTSSRYGAGISDGKLDQTSWEAWATYCAESVEDGSTRATFNGIFDTQQTVQDAMMSILKVGRAMMLQVGGIYYIVLEAPANPVQLFTVGNIKPGTFHGQFIPRKERPHAMSVDYLNGANNYFRKTYTHRGHDYDTTSDPLRIDRELLLGCTVEDEAKRYAILRHQLSTMLNRTCEFEVDVDAIACQPGDVVLVQHDSSWKTWGGRIVSAGASSVTLDRTVNLPASQFTDYGRLKVRVNENDTLEEHNITGPFDVDTEELNLATGFTTVPSEFDVFGVLRSSFDVHKYRILNMARAKGTSIKMSCIEYNEMCYYHSDYGAGVANGGDHRI